MSQISLDPEYYTIGWITILADEFNAARDVLDVEHERPKVHKDGNYYYAGSIGPHNIVIAKCDEAGTSPASTCATNMMRSFENIKVGLLVGIGGGVPSQKHDIRLGDVVVSKAGDGHGGVAFYDAGKLLDSGFRPTGHLNRPPGVLSGARGYLESDLKRRGQPNQFETILADVMEKSGISPPRTDQLYEAGDLSKIVERPDRLGAMPMVHYGLIASGSWLIKTSGSRREDLIKHVNGDVLCFEMEAAGLMNTFPCLVVRGISDYCDGHKNDDWHEYASTTAACYAKALVKVLAPENMDTTEIAKRTIALQSESMKLLAYDCRESWPVAKSGKEQIEVLLSRLSDYDAPKAQSRRRLQRTPGTTDWLLKTQTYLEWDQTSGDSARSCLWLSGDVGFGKTVLCTSVIDDQLKLSATRKNCVAFFFCDPSEKRTLDPSYALASLIQQLLQHASASGTTIPTNILRSLRKHFSAGSTPPDLDDHRFILAEVFQLCSDAVFVIDGLHEMTEKDTTSLMSILREAFSKVSRQKLLVSNRDHCNNFGVRQRVSSAETASDIRTYIEWQFDQQQPITNDPELSDFAKQELSRGAKGMFLWVSLQIDALLNHCKTDGQIRTMLNNLPPDLNETYVKCLARVPNIMQDYVLQAFKWIAFAERPLSIWELQEAIAFDLNDTYWDSSKFSETTKIIRSCAGLVAEDPIDGGIRLIHPSIGQFLLDTKACPPGFLVPPTTSTELGELCVNYLSFTNFSQAVQRVEKKTESIPLPMPKKALLAMLPSRLRGVMERSSPATDFITTRKVEKPQMVKDRNETEFALLNYARQYWPAHTRTSIPSARWHSLAVNQNTAWKVQPWAREPMSNTAYFHALLSWAARHGHLPLLNVFLEHAGKQKQVRDVCNLPFVGDGLPALHVASRLGHIGIVTALIKICDVNHNKHKGMTPLHFAAEKDHEDVAARLLNMKGLSLNGLSDDGETPLGLCARYGSLRVLQVLINTSNADVNKSGDSYPTPLATAIWYDNTAAALILLSRHEIDIGSPASSSLADFSHAAYKSSSRSIEIPALSAAAVRGNAHVATALLTHGSFNAWNQAGFSETRAAIVHAIRHERIDVLQLLISHSNIPDERSDAIFLHMAIETGNLTLVKFFLSTSGLDVNYASEKGAALHLAARKGSIEIFKALFRNDGIDVNLESNRFPSPIIAAAQETSWKIVDLLVKDHRTNINSVDHQRWSVLFHAAKFGPFETCRLILERQDLSINLQSHIGASAFMHACNNRSVEIIQLFLQRPDTDVRIITNGNDSALHFAADAGDLEVLQLLIARLGADANREISRVNKLGVTPLTLALNNGLVDVSAYLISLNDGSIDQKDSDGRTSLSHAASNGAMDIIKLLADHGNVDFHSKDLEMKTPLLWAAELKYRDIVWLLISKPGVRLDDQDSEGRTLAHWAATFDINIIEYLVAHHAAVDVEDKEGFTPLVRALSCERWNIGEILINSGADVRGGPDEKMSPLWFAVRGKKVRLVQLMLGRGAPVFLIHKTDRIFSTVRDMARERSTPQIVKLLDAAFDSDRQAFFKNQEDQANAREESGR